MLARARTLLIEPSPQALCVCVCVCLDKYVSEVEQ